MPDLFQRLTEIWSTVRCKTPSSSPKQRSAKPLLSATSITVTWTAEFNQWSTAHRKKCITKQYVACIMRMRGSRLVAVKSRKPASVGIWCFFFTDSLELLRECLRDLEFHHKNIKLIYNRSRSQTCWLLQKGRRYFQFEINSSLRLTWKKASNKLWSIQE